MCALGVGACRMRSSEYKAASGQGAHGLPKGRTSFGSTPGYLLAGELPPLPPSMCISRCRSALIALPGCE
eukprot:scaffold37857_cov23-Tisochrysis_lutea.AAC.3